MYMLIYLYLLSQKADAKKMTPVWNNIQHSQQQFTRILGAASILRQARRRSPGMLASALYIDIP